VARAALKGATSSIQPSPPGLDAFLKPTQHYMLGYFQPSLPGLDAFLKPTQHYVLGYFQPSRQCRDS
jgi:hypothetical protein